MNKEIMRALGFEEEVKEVEQNICPSCHTAINYSDFRDELSKKEYRISGLCQKCQDVIWGE